MYAYAANDPINARDPYGLCVTFDGASFKDHLRVAGGKAVYCPIKLATMLVSDDPGGGPTTISTRSYSGSATNGPPVGPVGGAGEADPPSPSCRRTIASAALYAGADVLTLYPGFAAWRAWQASKNIPALYRSGQLLGRAAHDEAARAAGRAFTQEIGTGAAGVGGNILLGVSEGQPWYYAVPIVGTGHRIGDAMIACLIKD